MKKVLAVFVFMVVYLVTSVPVGLFLYSLKSEKGIDVFSNTGFHAYMACLESEAQKVMGADN